MKDWEISGKPRNSRSFESISFGNFLFGSFSRANLNRPRLHYLQLLSRILNINKFERPKIISKITDDQKNKRMKVIHTHH